MSQIGALGAQSRLSKQCAHLLVTRSHLRSLTSNVQSPSLRHSTHAPMRVSHVRLLPLVHCALVAQLTQ